MNMTHSRKSSGAFYSPLSTDEDGATTPLLSESDSDDFNIDRRGSVRRSVQWDMHAEPSLGAVQPEAWMDITAIRHKFIRQILGLNPFKTSYFALYRPLDDVGSR